MAKNVSLEMLTYYDGKLKTWTKAEDATNLASAKTYTDEQIAALPEAAKYSIVKAETAEEREAIRKRMAEMDKERYAKDTENKTFYEKQQEAHRSHNLKILGSVAIVSGLVYKYRKPLMDMGRKLITKA